MNEMARGLTVGIKACCACDSPLLEHDKFCRWCGIPQFELMSQTRERLPQPLSETLRYATSRLAGSTRLEAYRRVSTPLVNAVVTGAIGAESIGNQNAFVRRIILGLISIPIWLIIVFVSPLDAYAVVRNLARQE